MEKVKKVTLRMPANIYKDMKTKSEITGNSVSSLMRTAAAEFLYGRQVKE